MTFHNIKLHHLLAVTVILSLITAPALASGISNVSGANVVEGKTKVQGRIGFQTDDTASQDERILSRVSTEYGVTDFWATEIIAFWDKREGDNWQYDAIAFENKFQFFEKDKYGFDGAAELKYKINESDADSLGVKFIQGIPFAQKWELRLNQELDHEIGANSESGLGFDLAHQVTYEINDSHKLGLESFHKFGNLRNQNGYSTQSHAVGPVLKSNWGYGIKTLAAYSAGVSKSAPDQTFKLFVGKDF